VFPLAQKLNNGEDGFVEIFAIDTEPNHVMPQPPAVSVAFQRLFGASESFNRFLLGSVAVGNVAPRAVVSVVDGDSVSETENCLGEILHSHVSTAAREPFAREKLVDLETQLKALDSLLHIISIEMDPG